VYITVIYKAFLLKVIRVKTFPIFTDTAERRIDWDGVGSAHAGQ
jgi:hypothetical protein